jgi:hypothetical protein
MFQNTAAKFANNTLQKVLFQIRIWQIKIRKIAGIDAIF